MWSQRGFLKSKRLPQGSHLVFFFTNAFTKTTILNVDCQKLSTKPHFGTQLKSSRKQMDFQKMLRTPSMQWLPWELWLLGSSQDLTTRLFLVEHCQLPRTSVQLWTLDYLLGCWLCLSIGCFWSVSVINHGYLLEVQSPGRTYLCPLFYVWKAQSWCL